jgi:hypothetical protein
VVPLIFFMLAAQASPTASETHEEQWPTARAERVIASPDWSDYRIYPMIARVKNEEGQVLPQVLVGPDGIPKACRIRFSSNFVELDEGSCRLMMQMKFEPVRDATGTPIASTYSRPLVWMLNDPRPFGSSGVKARLSIQGGRERSCKVVGGDGPYVAPWSAVGCWVFSDVQYYFGDASSKPLDATIEVRLDAGDQAPFLAESWPSGEPLAVQKIAFTVDENGDASSCTPVENRGLGARGMNNLSPCGGLLSKLWFEDAPTGTPARKGTIETRVYVINDNSQQPHP